MAFVVKSVNIKSGVTIEPIIKIGSIIQLNKIILSIPVTIIRDNTNNTSTTVYGMGYVSGTNNFVSSSGFSVRINPYDSQNKSITNTSTTLELIQYTNNSDYIKSKMSTIGTITVESPLIYKCVGKVAPNGTGVDIPNNSIFYLIKNDSSYDIYNNNGDRYDNIIIQLKDAQGKSIDENSTQILFIYNKYIRYKYKLWYRNYRHDIRNGSFIVSKISGFDYSTLADTTSEKNAKDDAEKEKERLERERIERERLKRARIEKERLEQERLERERIERESAAARARAEVIKNAQRQMSETQVLPTYDETAPLFVAAQFNPL